ncbi:hypothetical protein CK203_060392 [Vitis vinifera]|uniref:Uncharacterized protein n=1 Tax=Vitis vinifera TaxID=29760 RepID=A0A438GBR3_VITVI|nr:hypothetical protein CK203_060392 [Vitis vinifera]
MEALNHILGRAREGDFISNFKARERGEEGMEVEEWGRWSTCFYIEFHDREFEGDALLCEKHSPKSAWLFYGEEAEEKFVGHSFVPVFNAPEGKEEDGF